MESNFNGLLGHISNGHITGLLLSPNEIKADAPEFCNLDETMISPNIDNFPGDIEIKIEEPVITNEIPSAIVSTEKVNKNNMERKRNASISIVQKTAMIDFLDKHPNLLSGKFTSTFQQKHSKMLWMTLTEELNSLPGGRKDWRQWRKSWQDLKAKNKLRQEQMSKMKSKLKTSTLSIDQKNTMVAFHKKHLSGDRFTSPSQVKQATDLWIELADILNAMPGARRSWTHWRKTWNDIHSKAKSKKKQPIQVSSVSDKSFDNSVQSWGPKALSNVEESLVDIDWPSFDKEDESVNEVSLTIEENVCESPDSRNNSNAVKYDKLLTDTVAVAKELADKIVARDEYMRSYYERKLELMERSIRVKEEISDSLKRIAEKN